MFYRNLEKLQGARHYNDACLCFNKQYKVPVVRYILAAHNEFFLNLFDKLNYNGNEYDFNLLSWSDFELYYKYIHKGYFFEVTEENIFALLRIYRVFNNLDDIELSIKTFMFESNSKNMNWLLIVKVYGTVTSKDNKYDNINRQLEQLIESKLVKLKTFEQFKMAKYEDLRNFLSIPKIQQISPLKILQIYYTWIVGDWQKREEYINKICKEINDIFNDLQYDADDNELRVFLSSNSYFDSIEHARSPYSRLNKTVPNSDEDNVEKRMRKLTSLKSSSRVVHTPNKRVDDGKTVMLFGGIKNSSSIIEINLRGNESICEIGQLNSKRNAHSSEKIKDKIYTFGGKWTTEVESFNINTTKVEKIDSLEMLAVKHSFSSCVLEDNIYIFGGMVDNYMLDTVEYMNLNKMAWYTEKSMNTGLINHESVVTDNQVVYVTPGSKFNKIQRYDPRDIRSWSVLSPIPTNTLRSAVTLINNTEILMIGGFFKTDNANTCQVFDIRSSRWRTFPSIPQKLSSSKAAEIGDKIYLFGGQLDKESFTSEVYSYNKFNPIQKWEIVEGIELTAANGFFSKVVF